VLHQDDQTLIMTGRPRKSPSVIGSPDSDAPDSGGACSLVGVEGSVCGLVVVGCGDAVCSSELPHPTARTATRSATAIRIEPL
jgi:hypothetical protein